MTRPPRTQAVGARVWQWRTWFLRANPSSLARGVRMVLVVLGAIAVVAGREDESDPSAGSVPSDDGAMVVGEGWVRRRRARRASGSAAHHRTGDQDQSGPAGCTASSSRASRRYHATVHATPGEPGTLGLLLPLPDPGIVLRPIAWKQVPQGIRRPATPIGACRPNLLDPPFRLSRCCAPRTPRIP